MTSPLVANMVVRPQFSGNVAGHLDETRRQIARQLAHRGDRLLRSKLFRALKNDGVRRPVMPENVHSSSTIASVAPLSKSSLLARLAVHGEDAVDVDVLERRLEAVDIVFDEKLRRRVTRSISASTGDLTVRGRRAA